MQPVEPSIPNDASLKFIRHSANGCAPIRGSTDSPGFTLYSPKLFTILPKCFYDLDLEISVRVPYGQLGFITSIMGDAHFKPHLLVNATVVGAGFPMRIIVNLFNPTSHPITKRRGMKIALLTVAKTSPNITSQEIHI